MLDLKRIRDNPQELKTALSNRRSSVDVDELLRRDAKRREIIASVEEKKNRRNEASKTVGRIKREGGDAQEIMDSMKTLGDEIEALDADMKLLDEGIDDILYSIPNIPHDSVPVGADDSNNVVVREHGNRREFSFEPKPHWDVGVNLGILDFETAAKVTGARFVFYKGLGVKLERALMAFFLDTHTEAGYTEVLPPFLVNRNSMYGTGQLPKFEEEAFKVAGTEYFLIPTAEVPVTNMHRDSILEAEQLPICYTAYSACFRQEAGSAGRDTRGLIRHHQFSKVELVKFTRPEDSYDELEKLTADAERVLRLLGLPYRVSMLCSGDLGFCSAKTYDLEVWMPSYGRYVEISSCSNFETFQARRAGIRYRPGTKEKPQFVHTLNGSGVAIGRTIAAILENYQNEDGSVEIPEALRSYMRADVIKTQ